MAAYNMAAWSCAACTFINSNDAIVCGACEIQVSSGVDLPLAQSRAAEFAEAEKPVVEAPIKARV